MFIKKFLWMFLAVLLALVVAGCIAQNQPAQSLSPPSDDVSYETSDSIPPNINAEPSFKIGDRFEYEYTQTGWGGTAKSTFAVNSIEGIGGRDYYVISEEYRADYSTLTGGRKRGNAWEATYYFDAETGYFLKRIEKGKIITEGYGSADIDLQLGNIMFGPWMLSLSENFKWSRDVESNIGGKIFKYKNSLEVTETPLLNGRKTFKVEDKLIRNGNISQKEVFWIDSQKRITVKKEVFQGTSTKVAEVNLKSGLD